MNAERLLKLADHLESGKLGHDNFSLNVVHEEKFSSYCGTVGCAMGEMPFVFPDDFEFAYLNKFCAGIVRAKCQDNARWWRDVNSFFDITSASQDYLFYPSAYAAGFATTATEVAARIREFVESNKDEVGSPMVDSAE